MRTIICLAAAFLSLSACEPKPYFEETKPIVESGWAYTDTLAFQFDITDTSKRYTMQLDVAWADSFKHQNLYLKLGTAFPEGKYMQVVRSYDLYDQQGKPNGKKSGAGYQGNFVLQEGTRFERSGAYRFTVAQHTRDEKLTGIRTLGLRISEDK
jgi:gliding motility-associated lipoprotein GldH